MDEQSLPSALHQACLLQRLQMLRGVRDGQTGLTGQRFDRPLSLGEQFEDFDTMWARKTLADPGVQTVQAVFEDPVIVVRNSQALSILLE